MRKIIFYNLLFLFLGLILIELIFGNWIFGPKFSSLIIKRNITKVWNPTHYESNHVAMYKKDEFGFRGNYKNISNVKIITVGGSTTDERWIDENLTWSHLLQKKLENTYANIKVANAGTMGQSTIGHLKNFEIWFNQIPNLKPEYFIYYIGINDSILLLKALDKYKDKRNYNEADTLVSKKLFERQVRYLKNNSVFYKLFKLIDGYFLAKKYGVTHFTGTWKNKKKIKPIEVNKEDKIVLQFLIEYQKRLKKINERTKKYKSKTIFITQNVHKDHFLSNALNIINITTKNFCINNEIICLPLDEKVNFDFEKNFYDGIHTRPSGNKKIAEYISYELKKKIEKK
ncbi:MAG TPA: hypothetical protein QGF37_02100 [Candidatus Pelagibacter bacterium]|jgi:hypothetical protein|nr:hypothetical protein [Candidatus Pelagibacter bacterium]|tara:strand:- start:119 stop:1147 length:1029 start_codon:yes stop_codon:yes gene_type:complete